jgi:hypothetical protein
VRTAKRAAGCPHSAECEVQRQGSRVRTAKRTAGCPHSAECEVQRQGSRVWTVIASADSQTGGGVSESGALRTSGTDWLAEGEPSSLCIGSGEPHGTPSFAIAQSCTVRECCPRSATVSTKFTWRCVGLGTFRLSGYVCGKRSAGWRESPELDSCSQTHRL